MKFLALGISCGIGLLCSCKKENVILQSDVVRDIFVDSTCANSLGYSSDTVYTMFISNTFTPNQDGYNDIFIPMGKGDWKTFYFEVRNKYNDLVYQSAEVTNGWDGKCAGYFVSQGVYQYYVEVKTGCPDKVYKYRGGVLVVN